MRRLLKEDEPESESLIASPVRTPQLALSNRRGFQMERRHRDLSLDEVEINDPAQAAVHMEFSGGGYASFNPNGHSQDREEDESPMDNAPPLFGKYGDFHTIDWQRDLARDRLRHKLIAGKRADFPLGLLQSAWDAGAGWLCVLLVGLASGAIAGVIDIGARWMSDLKDGICANRFWLDREHCCWSSNDTFYRDSDCGAWMTWPELFNYSNSSPIFYVVEFLFYVGMAVLMSTLAVLFVKVFAPYACGSGIPEIKCILSGFVIRGYLGKWTFLIKSVGLILACASGLNLGKEGPTVHLACCIGNILSYIFPKYGMNEAKKREILSASAAAGVSVAFGAPIGGVLFSLEEASYYFPLKTMWRSFFCALIAGIILRIVNPFGSDQTSLFHVDYMIKWRFFELVPIIGLGLFGGILGSLFIFANIRWCRLRKNSKLLGQNPINEVIVVTLVTAVISYFNPYMRRSTSSVVKQLFDRCGPEDYMVNLCDYQNKSFTSNKVDDNYHTGIFGSNMNSAFAQLVMALIFRFILTVFTFGIKVPCGLFIPSIAMGAIAGRLTGVAMEGFVSGMQQESGHSSYWSCQIGKDCVMPGLYAMVGAAAVLGGITRMTVSLVVIMFELTGSLEFIVPTMVATMFSKWIADAISKEGIYDAHIELNGYPFLDNKGEYPYSTVASQVMRPTLDSHTELVVLTQEGMTLGDVEAVLRDNEFNGFPVVLGRGNMILVGFVSRRDLQLAIHSARKTQPYIVTTSPIYFTNQPTLHEPTSSSSMPGTPSAGTAAPLRLKKILDLAPMSITDQTPMETVIDMFRKLGLRQVLVTKNGKVLGIITKKDILQFMRQMEDDGMINPNYNSSSKRMDRKAFIHAPLYAGVTQDIEMLHAKYLEAETKNFSAFAAVFREFDFSAIYAGRIASYEAIEFAENALQIAASYMGSKRAAKTNREATLDDRRFGVFLTYSLFYLQPTDYVYQVPVTPNLMKEIQQLVRVVTLQRELDTLACLYKLLDDSAFRTFAFDKSYDPQCNKKYDVPDLKAEGFEDIEPPLPRADSILKSEQMNYMRLLHTTYVEGKNKLEETKRLRTVRDNAAEEMETIIKKARVEFEGKRDEMMQTLMHTTNTTEGAEDEEENEDEEGTDAEDAEESGQSRATSYMSN